MIIYNTLRMTMRNEGQINKESLVDLRRWAVHMPIALSLGNMVHKSHTDPGLVSH